MSCPSEGAISLERLEATGRSLVHTVGVMGLKAYGTEKYHRTLLASSLYNVDTFKRLVPLTS